MKSFYTLIADKYDSMYADEKFKKEDESLKLILRRFIYNGTVLDIGCGTGHLLEIVNIDSKKYLGIDPCCKMILLAKRKFPAYNFKCGSVLDLNQVYDNIIALYGVASYLNLEEIDKIKSLLNVNYFLMFYRLGYIPYCYKVTGREYYIKYWKSSPDIINGFPNKKRITFTNYEVVTNREDI